MNKQRGESIIDGLFFILIVCVLVGLIKIDYKDGDFSEGVVIRIVPSSSAPSVEEPKDNIISGSNYE